MDGTEESSIGGSTTPTATIISDITSEDDHQNRSPTKVGIWLNSIYLGSYSSPVKGLGIFGNGLAVIDIGLLRRQNLE